MKNLTLTKDEAETLMVLFDCIEFRRGNSRGLEELWTAYGDLMDRLSDRWYEPPPGQRPVEWCARHPKHEILATPGGKYCEECVKEELYCGKHPNEPLLFFTKKTNDGKPAGDCLMCAEERYEGK